VTEERRSGTAKELLTDEQAWDEFVAAGPGSTHLQTTAWANVKRANGWSPRRVAIEVDGGRIGSQILIRRAGRLPWRVGYVARGPVGQPLSADNLVPLTEALRAAARDERLAYLVFEPEVEAGHGLEEALANAGWRRTSHVQPESSRIVDLTRPEEALWSDLRSKWRQYVNKARRAGVSLVEGDEARLPEFYGIYADAYRRVGVTSRSEHSFRIMWRELAPRGMAHLFIAEADGQAQAAMFMLSCGPRIAEVYGGSTPAGNETRANYLLKWEAMMRARDLGFTEYDMYGIPHSGIAHFKAGFGGQEVQYVGAWELVIGRVSGTLLATANGLRLRWVRLRYGRSAAKRQEGAEA
jgi:lipid II:glycine glycyltransferase (peptidoglycan interpeptide bridge formation enzyme)